MGRPILFFATRNDLMGWLGAVAKDQHLALTEAGMFDIPEVRTTPLEKCDRLGISETGNHILDRAYLIHDTSMPILVREVPQRRGGVRYDIGQQLNPRTVGIKPSGTFSDSIVISGQMGLGTGDPWSEELVACLRQELKGRFTKVHAQYVGPEALSLLDSGARLTINKAAAPEYDLVR